MLRIKAIDRYARIYHIVTLSAGEEFIAAANKLLDGLSIPEHPTPTYYLYCHGIELAIKSWIGFKCRSEPFKSIDKRLRNDIGHNLQSAWEQTDELGLSGVSPHSQKLKPYIEWMNRFYQGKYLEYHKPSIKYRTYPDPRDFSVYVEQLVTDLDHHYRAVSRAEKGNMRQVTS